jgi:anti-sigma regulatory factor (Ser/Thr protein kinase)
MIALMSMTARLVLRTALPELQRLASWVEKIAHEAGFAADTVFALQLCLEEAVANIVMHGGAKADAPITVEIARTGDEIVAMIEDEAAPFDPTSLPERIAPASLDEATIGELGVHFMRNYASSMEYERRGPQNRLVLRFAMPPAPMPARP